MHDYTRRIRMFSYVGGCAPLRIVLLKVKYITVHHIEEGIVSTLGEGDNAFPVRINWAIDYKPSLEGPE
jgi:hypothetical protein